MTTFAYASESAITNNKYIIVAIPFLQCNMLTKPVASGIVKQAHLPPPQQEVGVVFVATECIVKVAAPLYIPILFISLYIHNLFVMLGQINSCNVTSLVVFPITQSLVATPFGNMTRGPTQQMRLHGLRQVDNLLY